MKIGGIRIGKVRHSKCAGWEMEETVLVLEEEMLMVEILEAVE